jgi:peptidoglycan/xylan/chitin deacetylase (PgdA/CDA1 family)/folate-dependent phosphoribosylglycinamide formyltransferase PurN
MNRVVIFTSGSRYSVSKGIAELLRSMPDLEILVVQHQPRRTWRRLWRNQWFHLRRNGLSWIPYELMDVLRSLGPPRPPDVLRKKPAPGGSLEWAAIRANPRVRVHETRALHSEETLAVVRGFAPDLGIVLAAPVLKPSLFEIPRLGTINLHKGRLPDFRGMPPAFWELYHDQSELGCTIHRVERGLDTGPILLERSIPRHRYTTVRGALIELDEVGVAMTSEGVRIMLAGQAVWRPQPPGGATFTRPTLAEEGALRRRLAWSPTESRVRRMATNVAHAAYIHGVRAVPRRISAARKVQRVVVLCYHRVNDDLRDSLTVGVEQFDDQMALLARLYPMVSMEDLVAETFERNASRPAVAVTFDDGYLDNWEMAVPILVRHRVPAAFFVSTAMIGTDLGFDHDRQRLGRTLPTMTWDHLMRMREMGFTIGSHTVSHINCARVDRDRLRNELVESRDTLRSRLGIESVVFAYPFGMPDDITPEGLAMVRELGYSGCVSAYGGANDGPIDPFAIRRIGVSCGSSKIGFRAALEGFSR